MEPEDLVKQGQIDQALELLKDRIRKQPAKYEQRLFLFQLFAAKGEWERALTQLNVAAEMNADSMPLGQVYAPALQAEALRKDVFEGKRSPLFFGEPAEWLAQLAQALQLLARGEVSAAAAMRDQAFEAAPSVSGKVDGEPFEWICDADPRLGPVFEAVINGKYYWVPFTNLSEVRLESPVFLKDVIWSQAHFVLTNRGEAHGLIPTRYPGTEASNDDALKLARRTDWEDRGEEYFLGLGQRMLATDAGDYPLLGIKNITFDVEFPEVTIQDILAGEETKADEDV